MCHEDNQVLAIRLSRQRREEALNWTRQQQFRKNERVSLEMGSYSMSCSLDVRVRPFQLQMILKLAFCTQLCEICLQFCPANTKPEALQFVWTRVFRLSPHACATSSFESEHVGEDLRKLSPFLKVWPPSPLCIRSLRGTGLLFLGVLIVDLANSPHISLNCHKWIVNIVIVNPLHSWQQWCLWHRFTKVDTEVYFILAEYLKYSVAELQSGCRLKLILMQSVALMLLILIQDLMLALAVSYCLPLRTFSAPPAVTRKHTFGGWSRQQNSTTDVKPAKRNPQVQHSVCHSSGLWSLDQRCSRQTEVGASALCRVPAAQVSHLLRQASTRQFYGECGTSSWVCTSLKVAQVNRNAAGLSGRVLSPNTCPSLQCIRQIWAGY